MSKPHTWPLRWYFLTVALFGITLIPHSHLTFTVYRSKNSSSSTCLVPLPFALNCRMVKGFLSELLVVIDDGSGNGVGEVGGEVARTVLNSLVFRYDLKTRTLRMNTTRITITHIAHPTDL